MTRIKRTPTERANMTTTRTERDFLGAREIPSDAY
jgi:hypothetical protein